MNRYLATGLLSVLMVGFVGCDEPGETEDSTRSVEQSRDDSQHDSIELTERVPVNRGGRTEIPTYNTGSGPLFITLPEGFEVRADRGLDYDMIFLYKEGDPIITGSATLPPTGIARLQISDSTVDMDLPGVPSEERRMVVGGVPVAAERSVDRIPQGGTYESYSISLPHFFASRDRTLDDLHLHIYVGGSDSLAVASLLESLGTLSFQP